MWERERESARAGGSERQRGPDAVAGTRNFCEHFGHDTTVLSEVEEEAEEEEEEEEEARLEPAFASRSRVRSFSNRCPCAVRLC